MGMLSRSSSAFALAIIVITTSGSAAAETQTWIGRISDSKCGRSHASMIGREKRLTDRGCTERCIEAGAKYVFVVDDAVYQIANQNAKGLTSHAGRTVALTGTLTGDTMTVSTIKRAGKKLEKH
ncbi:MAG TPA: hypothetical protein VLV86_10220 [Vicinamibacterales bacterium]|nr:hypothetical protein [Vicinamibacterales bacterium]